MVDVALITEYFTSWIRGTTWSLSKNYIKKKKINKWFFFFNTFIVNTFQIFKKKMLANVLAVLNTKVSVFFLHKLKMNMIFV